MVDQIPPWGRAHRRMEREAARELARKIMRTHNQGQQSNPKVDVALWFLAAFMALGLLLVAPKVGRTVTTVVLIAMTACLLHPVWQLRLVQTAPSLEKKRRRFAGIMLSAVGLLTLFGMYVWPPIRRHTLSAKERASFENALKPQKGGDLEVQIACPLGDEKTCVYAEQFINLVGGSGWKVESYVNRITLSSRLRKNDGTF